MKISKGLILALLLLLAAPFVTSQPSYLLVCRGGGDLYFNYTPFSNFSPNPQVWITFKRGAQGVGQNWEQRHSLEPGQAAWPDRGIGEGEPERLILTDVKEFSITWTRDQVMGLSSVLNYLSVLRDPNKFQSFHVFNDGKGNLIVTRVGPSM